MSEFETWRWRQHGNNFESPHKAATMKHKFFSAKSSTLNVSRLFTITISLELLLMHRKEHEFQHDETPSVYPTQIVCTRWHEILVLMLVASAV
jgi:hypothetical protein